MGGPVYELWDTGSGNVVGSFGGAAEALAAVRALLPRFGRDCADDLALNERRDSTSVRLVAAGGDLARLADDPRGRPSPVAG